MRYHAAKTKTHLPMRLITRRFRCCSAAFVTGIRRNVANCRTRVCDFHGILTRLINREKNHWLKGLPKTSDPAHVTVPKSVTVRAITALQRDAVPCLVVQYSYENVYAISPSTLSALCVASSLERFEERFKR